MCISDATAQTNSRNVAAFGARQRHLGGSLAVEPREVQRLLRRGSARWTYEVHSRITQKIDVMVFRLVGKYGASDRS
jgi:hypothetical protein